MKTRVGFSALLRARKSPNCGKSITAPMDAWAATLHAPPAGNMLWRNIGIALWQRRSTHEKARIGTNQPSADSYGTGRPWRTGARPALHWGEALHKPLHKILPTMPNKPDGCRLLPTYPTDSVEASE